MSAKTGGLDSNELILFCDRLLRSRKCKRAVRAILADKDHPHFVAMWNACADLAYGKPGRPIEHHGALVIHVVREQRPAF